MTVRKYTSRSQQTTLSSAVTSGATVIPVTNASTLFAGTTLTAGQTFTIVIDPDTALEEICDVTSASSNNLTVTRAVDMSGASAQDHSSGAVVRHMIIGRDLRESNLHVEATGAYNDGTGTHAMHGLSSSDGVVVGTTATQTLTNKTLTAPILTGAGVDASIVFEGTTVDAFETTLTVVDPTQDNTVTLPNTSGTVTINDATQTLTNKTLTTATLGSNLNAGAYKITNLATPTDASDAVRKDFADAQVAAAATSATSAAASATAAATSASSAATSATSAAASVSSIAAYATTASNSAAAAATSATSAAASATAAATSATSAAASVTTASNSASTATTQAAAASTSATSAAASATAAATSATSAAASATTAAASVASIATYASNALASQNAAATSATSAAASATAAATSASSAATSATSSALSYTTFNDQYLGSKASAPTLNNSGGSLVNGNLYFNTTDSTLYVRNAGAWQAAAVSTAGFATTGTNTFIGIQTAPSFVPNSATIPTNGMYLSGTDTVGFATASTLRMQMNASGNLSIGAGTSTNRVISMGKTITGNATSYGILNLGAVQSDVTSAASYYSTSVATQAATFTLSQLNHFFGIQGTFGTNSVVTNQMAFHADSSLIGATNNFGFYGNIPAGTNRWNVYLPGSAANYFNGQTSIGTSVLTLGSGSVDHQLGVLSTNAARVGLVIRGAASQTGDLLQIQNNAGTVLFEVDSAGNVGIGAVNPSVALEVSAGTNQIISAKSSGTGFAGLKVDSSSTATQGYVFFAVNGTEVARLTGNASNYLSFATGSSATERMRIDGSGNVNIGAATPAGGGTNTGGLSIAGKDIEMMLIMGAYY